MAGNRLKYIIWSPFYVRVCSSSFTIFCLYKEQNTYDAPIRILQDQNFALKLYFLYGETVGIFNMTEFLIFKTLIRQSFIEIILFFFTELTSNTACAI